MSYYSDATIADLETVLQLIAYSPSPSDMAVRFISASNDPDLVQVLQNIGQDAAGMTIKGWASFPGTFDALVAAMQGLEDNSSVTVTIQLDRDGGTMQVNAGGTDVVFP